MKALAVLRALGPIDLRSIRRDSFLVWIIPVPLLLGLLLRWAVPEITAWLIRAYGFDFTPYHGLLVSYVTLLLVPVTVGQLVGFLLLDERDDDTLRALLVTPLPLTGYLLYRISVPLLLCTVMGLLAIPLTGLVDMPWRDLLPIFAVATLEAPIVTLLVACVARNKVQGLALAKVISSVQMLPVLAYFLDPPWQYAAALMPNYWVAKAFWLAEAGATSASWLLVAGGLAYHLLLLWLLLRWFRRVVYR